MTVPTREPVQQTRRRAHTLLRLICMCGIGGSAACLACAAWNRHHRIVTERRAAWLAEGVR